MNDGHKPDGTELALRYAFGGFFGFAFGCISALQWRDWSQPGLAGLIGSFTVICALLARWQGDRFWERTIKWLRWW
jgi:hypothetical protein